MRLALVSDIHGNLPALQAVCADFARHQVDTVINLGDSLSGPLLPLETAQFLMQQSTWVHLAGNHERQILLHPERPQSPSDAYACTQLGAAELRWIASLKPSLAWSEEVLLCHGSPRSDVEYLCESISAQGLELASTSELQERLAGTTAKVVACGHSHLPRILRLQTSATSSTLIVNPGSVGLPAYDDDFRYQHKVETGASDARYALLTHDQHGWHASLHSVAYDYESMAKLAELNQRPDWAYALRTGYALSRARQQ